MYKLQVYTVWYVYIDQENVIKKNVPMKDTSLQSVTFKTLNCNSSKMHRFHSKEYHTCVFVGKNSCIKRRKTDNDAMIKVAKV